MGSSSCRRRSSRGSIRLRWAPGPVIGTPLAVALVTRYFVSAPTRRKIDVAGVSIFAILLATSMTYPSYPAVDLGSSTRAVDRGRGHRGTRTRSGGEGPYRDATSGVPLPCHGSVHGPDPVSVRRSDLLLLRSTTVCALGCAALRYARVAGGLFPVALLVTYTLFGFAWLDRGAIYFYAHSSVNSQTVLLDSHRASIRVTKREIGTILPQRHERMLERHSTGAVHLGGSRCAELYFLTDKRNPTRSFGGRLDDQSPQRRASLENLEQHGVTAIAINHRPGFHNNIGAVTARMLRVAYPNHVDVGNSRCDGEATTVN